MSDEVKRGPGRPPKVAEAAKVEGDTYEPVPPKRDSHDEVTVTKSEPKKPEHKDEPPPRMVEVELTRKYAPGGQKVEIQQTVPPGTVMELPVHEATRALKLGIARATDETFNDGKSK
jgi:hypothetical protein